MKRIGDAIQSRTQANDPQSYHVIPYRGGTWGHNGKTSPANKTRAKQIKVKNAPLVYRGGGHAPVQGWDAHAGSRARVTSMGGLYDAANYVRP